MGRLSTKTLRLVVLLLLLATLAATLTACGDSTTTKTTAPTTTQTPSTTAASGDQERARIVPGGECQCSDGSEFSFWVREANPKKIVRLEQGDATGPTVGFRAAFAQTSFRDPVLRAGSQAGLVNNLNDALAWGLAPSTSQPMVRACARSRSSPPSTQSSGERGNSRRAGSPTTPGASP
jgi:hypothetical protein